MANGNNGALPKPVRCAIYTRKSTEEGLDQAFNSLDAQREAAEADNRSQAGEGWSARPGYPERRYPATRSFSSAWCKSIFTYVWYGRPFRSASSWAASRSRTGKRIVTMRVSPRRR